MAAAIEAGRVEAEHTWAMKAWRIILILSAAQFILVLDTTVMNVSISNVLADLNTNVESAQLAITAYMLVMASTMLIGGKLGNLCAFRNPEVAPLQPRGSDTPAARRRASSPL